MRALYLLFFVLSPVFAPQFAADRPGVATADQERHNHVLLLGLLRTINTAEATEFSKYGAYASWQALLLHQPEYLNGWIEKFYAHDPNTRLSNLPEILPGWSLRLNVQADNAHYLALLEDTTDKTGYAVLSDERGLIRECKWLQ